MKRSRFADSQILVLLNQAVLGMAVSYLTRHMGISEQMFYRCKKQYAGLQSDQVRELKQLQDENTSLKKVVADLSLDKAILQDINQKIGLFALKRQAVNYVVDHYRTSRRRACCIVNLYRVNAYYRLRNDPKLALRALMPELAQIRIRYGYRRLNILLQREVWSPGKDQAYRRYNGEALPLRSKRPRRRKMVVARRERYVPKRANQAWSMDFVADQLIDETRIRILTVRRRIPPRSAGCGGGSSIAR